jgi:hypothetical protein
MGQVVAVWVVSNCRPFLTFNGRTDLVTALKLAAIKRFYTTVCTADPGMSAKTDDARTHR